MSLRLQSFRRACGPVLLASLVLVWTVCLSNARAQSPDAPKPSAKEKSDTPAAARKLAVEFDGGLGFSTIQHEVKPGVWYPAWAVVKANDRAVKGRLVFTQEGNPLRVEVPVDVPKGDTKRFRTFYRVSPPKTGQWRAELVLEEDRGNPERLSLPLLPADPADSHVLVLCDDPGSLFSLSRKRDIADNNGREQTRRAILYGAPEALPDDPVALESLSAIVISTSRVKAITAAQWDALERWVWLGGRLLLAGGRHGAFVAQSPLGAPFGSKIQPEAAASLLAELGDGAKIKEGSDGFLATWAEPPEGGWNRVWAGSRARPLLAGVRRGRGWFHFSAAALDPPLIEALNSLPGMAERWRAILEETQGPDPLLAFADLVEPAVAQRMQLGFGVSLAGAWWVFWFLASYIILAVPVNWWICARLKRREWAWGVAVLLAVAYSAYGASGGAVVGGGGHRVASLAFVSRPAGSPVARVHEISSVFAPRRYSANLATEGRVFPSTPGDWIYKGLYNLRLIVSSSRGIAPEIDIYSNARLNANFAKGIEVGDFFVHPMSARDLRCDYTARMNGGIEEIEAVTLLPKQATGKIVNKTGWNFSAWWLAKGDRLWCASEPLRAGDEVDLAGAREGYPNEIARISGENAILRGEWTGLFSIMPAKEIGGVPDPISWVNQQHSGGDHYGISPMQTGRMGDGFEITFIGVAQGYDPPLAPKSKGDGSSLRLIYAQSFGSRPTITADVRGGVPMWGQMLATEDYPRPVKFYPGSTPGRSNVFDTHPRLVELELGTDSAHEFAGGGSARLELHMAIKAQVYPSGVRGEPSAGSFDFKSCPLALYNFIQRRWVDCGVWSGDGIHIPSISEFINQGDQTVRVRLDLRPSGMQVKFRIRTSGEFEPSKTDTLADAFADPWFRGKVPNLDPVSGVSTHIVFESASLTLSPDPATPAPPESRP